MRFVSTKFLSLLLVSMVMFLSGCSKDSEKSPISPPVSKTTITGSVFAPAVSGSTVIAKNANGQTIAGPVISSGDGTYSIDIPTSALASDVTIEAENGTFNDEASKTQTTAGKMATFVKGGELTTGSTVNITPSTTIHSGLITKFGGSPDNASAAFAAAFGFAHSASVTPKNLPLVASDADTLSRLSYLRAAAFSQLTKDLGLTPDKQFELLSAISEDLADGTLDGKGGTTPITIGTRSLDDIQCKFACALSAVQLDSSINKTNLTCAQIGTLPFGKTLLTSTYKIEYIPGMMAVVMGKTSFKLKVTKIIDGSPATGLAISLMPKMYMATKNHSTPFEAVTEDANSPGTYKCLVYYLMASGPGMGYWELKVTIGSGMPGETGNFYPPVGMAMGTTTVRGTLKGISDIIAGSPTTVQRTYFLFNDGSTTSTAFNIFLAARETMMSHPAVSTGTTLHNASNVAWVVSPITLSASTDKSTWVDATDYSGGHWKFTGLTGLTTGITDTIYVKLTVNGEQKTTDGMALGATNGIATFVVTP